jgi:segregation and condensation protein A
VPISLQELERRLKEYEQFKSVAQLLAQLHQLAHRHFTRDRSELPDAPQAAEAAGGFHAVGVSDLVGAFSKVLERATAPIYEVSVEPWTVEMKVKDLRVWLAVKRQVRFSELFHERLSRLELVVTFLALLELIRQRYARAMQERAFEEIIVAFCSDSVES